MDQKNRPLALHPHPADKLLSMIQTARTILLTTHKQPDGDGLGAELGFFHALQNAGKNVRLVHVDEPPPKYSFMPGVEQIEVFSPASPMLSEWTNADLALIFDTNDARMIHPFSAFLIEKKIPHAFIDHHPLPAADAVPTALSFIETNAASTGEVAYGLLEELGYPFNLSIAICLYTSVAFDTQLYRFIRNSPRSHEIASKLLAFPVQSSMIHERLFANQTVEKVKFVGHAIGQIEFFESGKIAFLVLKESDLERFRVQPDDVRDVIDFVMNIETLEAAAVIREDGLHMYKLSLRSKGRFPILTIAEKLGGGGHPLAAGTSKISMPLDELRNFLVEQMTLLLKNYAKA